MRDLLRNVARAQAVIDFIESLRVPEGQHAGQPLRLRDWQRAIVRRIYEPARKAGDRLLRLVRTFVYSVAKKNGKTPLIAALVLAHLCGPEAVLNGQLYSAAYEREQAAITFRYARQMVEMDEELAARLNIKTATKEIEDPISGSIYKALSSDSRSKHGLGPVFLIFDELAQFGRDREFYDTLMQGRGAHEEPLALVISTQAKDDSSVLSELIDYGLRVNRGEIEDPTFVLELYEVPESADIFDESVWVLANPALGDFLSLDDMREAARMAKDMPSAESTFRNLRLNQRVDADDPFISPNVWKSCGCAAKLETFAGAECFGGLDLSSKNDLSALVLVAQAGDGMVDVLPLFWTPGDTLAVREKRDRAPYGLWRDRGHLEAVPGRVIGYDWVAHRIAELLGQYHIAGIKFDRWRIDDLRRELDKAGVEAWIEGVDKPVSGGLRLVPHGQGFKDFTPAVEVVEDMLTSARLRHGMHPVLTWCASNTRVATDPAGGRKFDKKKSTGRIDGMVALAMALNGATGGRVEPAPSVYEGRGLLTF